MRVSSRTRYGLKACFVLAVRGNEVLPIGELVKGSQVAPKYLEKILGLLVRGGLVSTVRGPNGGYYLARPASEISVGDIFRVLEDNLDITDCELGCTDDYCPNRNLMKQLSGAINGVLDGYRLSDLVRDNTCRGECPCASEEHV